MEFQKYDVKEKKKEKKETKNEQRKTNKVAKIIKKIQVQNWYQIPKNINWKSWVEFGIADIRCYIKEEEKETEGEKEKKKSQKLWRKYRYKVDNKYQKAKVKKSRVEFGISKIQC